MIDCNGSAKPVRISRRSFLKTSAGVVALTIIGAPLGTQVRAQSWSPTPGVATQRIEGVTKVTGGKIFARDYNSRDLDGWPKTQWYAMFLRALTTTRKFLDVDLSVLGDRAKPKKVILGNNLATGQLNPILTLGRDNIVDEQLRRVAAAKAEASGYDFDRPEAVEFDLLVRPGNRADFLGQAVALLLFDDLATYRAAKRQMQFHDAVYQVYGPEIGPNPDEPAVFDPQTLYVRNTTSDDPTGGFSYFNSNYNDYAKDAADNAKEIETYLATTPDLIQHRFTSDMRPMDPMFMEPESGLIWYDASSKTMNVLLGTQSPDGDIKDICSMYPDEGSRLNVETAVLISCYPGGGFGGRDSSPFSLMLALCADFADGHPVKLDYDRFEQFRFGLKRHACDLTGLLAVSPEQKIEVVQMNMSFDGGGRKNLSPYVASLAALCAGGSYVVPKANIFAKAIHTQNISGGSQRGFGGPQAFFAIETAIDEVAVQQHWDPLEFRRNNVVVEGDTTVVGGPINQELQLPDMLQRAADHPLWSDRNAIKDGYAQRGLTYGTGLAMSLQAYGTSGDGVVAAVILNPDGTYDVQSDAVDMGNGSATTLGVVIGNILGANASTVEMGGYTLFDQTGLTKNHDTGCKPDASWDNPKITKKSVGSSSACLTGLHQVHVVQQTATAVMANTIMPAALFLWGNPDLMLEDVKWQDGRLTAYGLDPLSLDQIAQTVYDEGLDRGAVAHAYFQGIWVSADFETASGLRNFELDGLAYYPSDGSAAVPVWRSNTKAMSCDSSRAARYVWSPCVNVIGLAVDRRTGMVQIENALSILNAGRIHVEPLVSGQSQGGIAMAIGYTLHEDMPPMASPANGTWNLNAYHVPRYHDVPLATEYVQGGRSQELVIMPETDADMKRGRGIAEAVMCSVAPAISNALRDAVGVRYTSLPITPQKILEGLNS